MLNFIDSFEFSVTCCVDREGCFESFGALSEECLGDAVAHMNEAHPDDWDGEYLEVELVPPCMVCGSPRVREHPGDVVSFKCFSCGRVMTRVGE